MQDTKTKTDINLIQFHKITSRHVTRKSGLNRQTAVLLFQQMMMGLD